MSRLGGDLNRSTQHKHRFSAQKYPQGQNREPVFPVKAVSQLHLCFFAYWRVITDEYDRYRTGLVRPKIFPISVGLSFLRPYN